MAMNALASTKGIETAQWHALRRQGIGGSDAAAVAGFNPYKSPVGVYLEKTGQIEPEGAGEAAYWGNVLEDVVAKEFSTRTGLKVKRSNFLFRHHEHTFMLGNIDRLVTDSNGRKGILECKTASAFLKNQWVADTDRDSDECSLTPDHYMIQLQHYLKTLELDFGFFAVLIGGNTFKYRYVERDKQMIEYLVQLESRFWNENVMKVIPPIVDGTEASTNLLNYLYPTSRPESSIVLPSDAETDIQELYDAQQAAKDAETRLDAAKNRMKERMKDCEIAYFNGEPVATWKSSERNSLDTKTLKAKLPDVYQQFVKTTAVRTFLVK